MIENRTENFNVAQNVSMLAIKSEKHLMSKDYKMLQDNANAGVALLLFEWTLYLRLINREQMIIFLSIL